MVDVDDVLGVTWEPVLGAKYEGGATRLKAVRDGGLMAMAGGAAFAGRTIAWVNASGDDKQWNVATCRTSTAGHIRAAVALAGVEKISRELFLQENL